MSLKPRFQRRFAGKNILHVEKHAMLRAIQSRGYSQARGQGYLVLTDYELYFDMTLLDIEIEIPLTAILSVEKVWRLLGVSPGRPMLKVVFTDRHGNTDAIALSVKGLPDWIERITRAVAGRH